MDQTLHRVATKEREEIKRTVREQTERKRERRRGQALNVVKGERRRKQRVYEDARGG